MDKVYFTGGINTINDRKWGVLRHLQEKINEIVEWINKWEKDNRLTMQELVRLMQEDMKE